MKVTLQSLRLIPFNIFLARIGWLKIGTKYFSMKNFLIFLILFVFLFVSCAKNKPNIITYKLKRSDYLEKIDATGTIQAVNNILILAPTTGYTNLLKVTHLAEDGAHVIKGDTICVFEVPPELLAYVETLSVDLQKMEGDLRKLEADNTMRLSMLNAQVETNKAQIAISMLDSIQTKFAPPIKKQLLELEMQKATIEKNKLQKKFAAQKIIDNSELIKLRSRIMMQKNRIQLVQNEVNSLKLVSPVDGIIMHLENYRLEGNNFIIGKIEEGCSTLSNMSVLQIPDMNIMQVSLEVQEADYKRIQNGQKVLITIASAVNLNTTGKIKRKTLQRKNVQVSSSLKTYEILISVDSCHLRMKPGLSASCRIIVDEARDTIVVPVAGLFERDSSKIVYVADRGQFISVIVETGLSNSSNSIVSKGLRGNEEIALSEPPHNLIRNSITTELNKSIGNGQIKNDSSIKNLTIKN
jgi:HlyD family secretion protein